MDGDLDPSGETAAATAPGRYTEAGSTGAQTIAPGR